MSGERQDATTLDGVRRDHVARYEWAARSLSPGARVADFACGVGYGTKILHDAGYEVSGYDRDAGALECARRYYPGPLYSRAIDLCPTWAIDAAVCFETIEHVKDPRGLLRSFAAAGATQLLASVPNEEVIPFGPQWTYHLRHYTRGQFMWLLESVGWLVDEWWGQRDAYAEVEPATHGRDDRTLVVACSRL